jgi:glycosyltransferase involved in cell wall biosynthesis
VLSMSQQSSLSISVAICAYNEQDWLGNTLLSLTQQSRLPDEIVIVNNASTDKTRSVAESFAEQHKNLNVNIVDEPKQGLHHARETGWRSAKSDLVVTTDADIRFPTHWLRNYEKAFLEQPGYAAMSGPVRYYDALFFINWLAALFEMSNQPEGIGKFFTKRHNVNGGNSAYRREALLAVNGYLDKPKGIFEDQHISGKLQDAGYNIHWFPGNPVQHTFRRFKKDGWRGYWRFIFDYKPETVYPDHLATD